jgi:uncharacterized protein YjbJ (UPF0337 family)
MSSSDKQTNTTTPAHPTGESSTLGSYVDSAVAAVQDAIGSLTGNADAEHDATAHKQSADAKDAASHTAARAGPFTLSGEGGGAVARDSSDRSAGSWNQTVGSAKESLGGLLGAESLRQAGIEQNRQGKEQEARGQLGDLASGVGDRVKGVLGGAVAGATGDEQEAARRREQHDQGKTMQRGVEMDFQKQAEAIQKQAEKQRGQN